jgi:hypothetical protein
MMRVACRLIEDRGREAKLIEWLDEITALAAGHDEGSAHGNANTAPAIPSRKRLAHRVRKSQQLIVVSRNVSVRESQTVFVDQQWTILK